MKATLNQVRRRLCRKSSLPARLDGPPKAEPRKRHQESIQLIYAHFPPAAVLAAEQHLRAQTNIERRAHQLWFAQGCRAGVALNDWVRAECEVVQDFCQALLSRNTREPEPDPVFQ